MDNYRQVSLFGTMEISEKLEHNGARALTDRELLQAMVGYGIDDTSATEIAENVVKVIEEVGADNVSVNDLKKVDGIDSAKASLILAASEFWRRKLVKTAAPVIDSPEKAAKLLDDIRGKKQEHFVLLTLNGARRLIKKHTVTIGTLMSSLVHPREIFSLAIEDRAASIIVGHNHPSGYTDISENDREVTSRLRQVGEIVGIRLDDHIIVAGDSDFVSAY